MDCLPATLSAMMMRVDAQCKLMLLLLMLLMRWRGISDTHGPSLTSRQHLGAFAYRRLPKSLRCPGCKASITPSAPRYGASLFERMRLLRQIE
jgi:cytochrome c-type biogenesis protein CcmH/NrfF